MTSTDTGIESVPPLVVLRPSHGWRSLKLGELWSYRELLYFLTWRDVLIRYKQAVLGVAWAVLQPFLTMIVFTLVFSGLMNVSSGDTPYALFSLAALVPWQLFAGGLNKSGATLVANANLLTKVYFPRLIMPTSAVLAGLVDFAIGMVLLAGMMVYFGVTPTWNVLWLPLLVVLTLLTALSVSLWLSALNVMYRDVQYVIPLVVQLWMFVSPVIYSTGTVPAGPMRIVYGLNPMAGVIQGFRWALLGEAPPSGLLLIGAGVVIVVFVGGLFFFKRVERTFADVV